MKKLNYYHSNYYYYHYHHWIITALPGDVCPDRYFITKQLFESAYIYIYDYPFPQPAIFDRLNSSKVLSQA